MTYSMSNIVDRLERVKRGGTGGTELERGQFPPVV
jgi:hypothetical protein